MLTSCTNLAHLLDYKDQKTSIMEVIRLFLMADKLDISIVFESLEDVSVWAQHQIKKTRERFAPRPVFGGAIKDGPRAAE